MSNKIAHKGSKAPECMERFCEMPKNNAHRINFRRKKKYYHYLLKNSIIP